MRSRPVATLARAMCVIAHLHDKGVNECREFSPTEDVDCGF